jgi:hypothetical protein
MPEHLAQITFFIILSLRYWEMSARGVNKMSSSVTSQGKRSGTDFAGEHESSNEDPFTSPTFGGYPKVGLRPLDINESNEHDCGADSGRADHPPYKLSEPAVFLFAVVRYTIKR